MHTPLLSNYWQPADRLSAAALPLAAGTTKVALVSGTIISGGTVPFVAVVSLVTTVVTLVLEFTCTGSS